MNSYFVKSIVFNTYIEFESDSRNTLMKAWIFYKTKKNKHAYCEEKILNHILFVIPQAKYE